MEAQRDVTYEEAKQFAEENGGFLLRLSVAFRRVALRRIPKDFDSANYLTIIFNANYSIFKGEEIAKYV